MLDLTNSPETSETTARPIPRLYSRICGECGQPFQAQRPHAVFCCQAHNRAYQNRLAVQGRAIAALAKAWQACRNNKGNTEFRGVVLNEMCSIINGFCAEDREAGRIDPITYAKTLVKGGRYIDRQRSR